MLRHRLLSRPLLALSLAGILLFAQWLLVQHSANLEQHASSHACEWCLTHAPLTGAVPAAAAVMAYLPAPLPPISLRYPFIAGDPLPAYVSRAPPRLLPV
jgi:hypothetical protein